MAEPTTNTTAPAATTNPTAAFGIAFNGKTLPFKSITNNRGKGPEKGAPLVIPAFAQDGAPNWREVNAFAEGLGADKLAKVVGTAILRDLFVDASKKSRTQNADGSFAVDYGKFVAAAAELLTTYTQTQSVKAQLEAQLQEVEGKIAEMFQTSIETQMAGKVLSQEQLNASANLMLRRAKIQQELTAKTRKAVAAATAPAAPAAPAVQTAK